MCSDKFKIINFIKLRKEIPTVRHTKNKKNKKKSKYKTFHDWILTFCGMVKPAASYSKSLSMLLNKIIYVSNKHILVEVSVPASVLVVLIKWS